MDITIGTRSSAIDLGDVVRGKGTSTDAERVAELVARATVLLVACDFDGTLAPIAADHSGARIDERARAALSRLSAIPHTHVAVISGRALDDLRTLLGAVGPVHLAGSHGLEIDGHAPPRDLADGTHHVLLDRLRALAAVTPGAAVEVKPFGAAFHYRRAEPEAARQALAALEAVAIQLPGFSVVQGSKVVEFLAGPASKGEALRAIRRQVGATAAIFVGDDRSDEDAFAVLGIGDAAVKVGAGETRAAHRVDDVPEVCALLEEVARRRERWVRTRTLVPIDAHIALSDQRTMALVDRRANIAWLCLPRLDSSALFAELLGGPAGGHFGIAPLDDQADGVHEYDGPSMVARTRWPSCTVTDYLDCSSGRAFQRAGRSDLLRVVEGSGRVRLRFAPRLDFGRLATRLRQREGGLEIEGAADPVVLLAPGVAWEIIEDGHHQRAEAVVDLGGGPLVLELRHGTANLRPHPRSEGERRDQTRHFWSAWAASLALPQTARPLVLRSALLLRALCHGPSGAIAAAGTTSLPEHLGGSRNWDYRYAWPRDAALAAAALVRLGNTGTAMRLLDWLLAVVDRCESPDRLRPIYTVVGGDLGPEAEIGELEGYGGSRPVRIGNAASQQVQLDVFGPIADLAAMLAERGAPISPDHWRLTRAMVEAVEARWQEPDHGIWEVRGPQRHHLHSKVMCHQTVARALVVHEAVRGETNSSWMALRDRIRADILANGFNQEVGAFTAWYGSSELDAAVLQIGLTGLVASDDPRWRSTVEHVERALRRGPVVDRYRYDDRLAGKEGGFHLCTSWLIESLLSVGRPAEARELFDGLVALASPCGILSEQYDPVDGLALGNTPQAYSHLALINAALAIDAAFPLPSTPETT